MTALIQGSGEGQQSSVEGVAAGADTSSQITQVREGLTASICPCTCLRAGLGFAEQLREVFIFYPSVFLWGGLC